MNKNNLFTIITAVGLFIIFISLLFMMLLVPSFKEKSSPLYKQEHQTTVDAPIKISTNFILKTISGAKFDSKTLRGKFLFIYFGNTHCPNICSAHLLEMQNISHALQKKQGSIKFLFITTDPEKDTTEHLNNYFKTLDQNIIPLTGTKKEINYVLKNFKIYKILFGNQTQVHADTNILEQQTCNIIAPAPFYLIGKDGDLIKDYKHDIPSKNIAKDIAHYIKVS